MTSRRMIPRMLPVINATRKLTLRKIMTATRMGITIKNRFFKLALSAVRLTAALLSDIINPKTMNRTKAGIAEVRLYQTRERTVGTISTSWPIADVMVTSEIGDKLLPNSAPEQIAPNTSPAGQPICTPKGNSIGIVPRSAAAELPVTVDMIAHNTKVIPGTTAAGILNRLIM